MLPFRLDDLQTVAQKLLQQAETKILLFEGDMGVGKTTLIKQLVKVLGSTDEVNSPTFSIVNEYESPDGPVFHFDLYRIEKPEEALDFGVEEYLYSGNYCLIEWPDKLGDYLPESYDTVKMALHPDGSRSVLLNGQELP